jgi:DNA repair protein RecO
MSYHIYTTDGIVLKRRNFGESNALFFVLTKDLGMIMASAQAVRSHASKLSKALQEYSFVSLSCVKGKNGWKITSAIPKENFFFGRPQFAQKIISQIAEALVRMMPGEEKHAEIFSVVQSGFSYLRYSVDEKNAEKEIANFEVLIMLRILYLLGYIGNDKQTEKFLVPILEWNRGILMEVSLVKTVLVEKINKGLKESHL